MQIYNTHTYISYHINVYIFILYGHSISIHAWGAQNRTESQKSQKLVKGENLNEVFN